MTTGSSTVSVVVPTYGRSASLAEAIKSVAAQTYENIELLVVDDASPEYVETVVDSVDTGNIRVLTLHHDENRGASAARNTGMDHASGRYLAFLDDDDRWLETKLERQVRAFQRASNSVGVVYTGQRYVDENGRTTNIRTPTTRGNVTEALLTGEPINPFSCVMVRAKAIERVGELNQQLPAWQDREWYLRLSRHYEFEPIPDPLVIRRFQHQQLSGNYEAMRDVSFPFFLSEYRSMAAASGREAEFVAHLYVLLATAALGNDQYFEALRNATKAVSYAPANLQGWLLLLVSLGGPVTYKTARTLKRMVNRLQIDNPSRSDCEPVG